MTKISDAPLVTAATDDMKMPTGEVGDLAMSVGQIKANVLTGAATLFDPLGAAAAAQAAAAADATTKANAALASANSYTDTGLAGKQNTLGFTPENVANKSTDVNADQGSNTKYPSVKAVYDWAVYVHAMSNLYHLNSY